MKILFAITVVALVAFIVHLENRVTNLEHKTDVMFACQMLLVDKTNIQNCIDDYPHNR